MQLARDAESDDPLRDVGSLQELAAALWVAIFGGWLLH